MSRTEVEPPPPTQQRVEDQSEGKGAPGPQPDAPSPGRQAQGERTTGEQRQRKQEVLTRGTPSTAESISHALVIKDGDVFFLASPDGRVPADDGHGLGLYYHDCRYLCGYEMKLAGALPVPLVATAERGFAALFELTNPDLDTGGGRIAKETLGIKCERVVDGERLALFDRIGVRSYANAAIDLPVELCFAAGFEDVFAIRGLLPKQLGTTHPPRWQDGALVFRHDGADGLVRRLAARFQPEPEETGETSARFTLHLDAAGSGHLLVALQIAEGEPGTDREEEEGARGEDHHEATERALGARQRSSAEWMAGQTGVRCAGSPLLELLLDRSLRDLHVLRSRIDGRAYFAAGTPWFATLFGRDSVIAALQTLAYDPQIAAETLRLLASLQGREVNAWRDEQPGKILHELRVGEMARAGEIPHTPYYGTIDATPLFLILFSHYTAWTGDLALFRELGGAVEAALGWMRDFGDLDGDGYIEYASSADLGLINQGWKDSGNAIVDADGNLAEPPIALVEEQAYAYAAKSGLAGLYRRIGEPERAAALEREAAALGERFNRDFWLPDKGIYALALQGKDSDPSRKRPAAVVSSNPGHALWAGIADPDKAAQTVAALMSGGMWSGWGVRTLSSQERAFNPIGYHLGTVWPHDNSLLAAGFRRYGHDREALRLFTGIVQAAARFPHLRLPELFAGFPRDGYGVPVHYPVACHPQAWAAGALPYLLTTLLGLRPAACEKRLRIVRPLLPPLIDRLELCRLRVGGAHLDLAFERAPHGVAVEVLGVDGEVAVVVEP